MPTISGPMKRKFTIVTTRNMSRSALSFHKYLNPTRIDAQMLSAAESPEAADRPPPPRISSSAPADTAKLSASRP